jgi:hypothetical protein
MADAALTYRMRPETSGFFNSTNEVESDYRIRGQGHVVRNRVAHYRPQASGRLSGRVDDYPRGLAAGDGHGQRRLHRRRCRAAAAAKHHVITWKDTGEPAQLTNIYIEDAPA